MSISLAQVGSKSNKVDNVIVAEDKDFKLEGYYFVTVDGLFCQPGMFYDKKNKIFCFDSDLKESPTYHEDGTYSSETQE